MGKEKENSNLTIYEILSNIQCNLKVSKSIYNSFANFYYRNIEDIFKEIKPFLKEYNATLLLTDELLNFNDTFFIKSTATITNGKESISTTSFARMENSRKQMSLEQITGSANSYARKYALSALFLLDDSKDVDSVDNRENGDEANKQEVKNRVNQIAVLKKELAQTMKNAKIPYNKMAMMLKTLNIDTNDLEQLNRALEVDWVKEWNNLTTEQGE